MISLPVEFSCCFRCSSESIKAKVDDLISSNDPLPNEAAWLAARDRMLLPVLRRIAALDTSHAMPPRWTDLSQALPPCPPGQSRFMGEEHRIRSLARIRFWEMCRMARLDYAKHQSDFQRIQSSDSLFHAFSALGDSILQLLILRMRPEATTPRLPGEEEDDRPRLDHDAVVPVWNQIKLLRNHDTILQIVYKVAEYSARHERRGRKHWDAYIHTMAQCGALEYGRSLALSMVGRQKDALTRFARRIDQEIKRQDRMRLALAMSAKDPNSPLHILGADVLRLIGALTRVEQPVLWEDVLHPYIQHDMLVEIE
jgi:hypothetical protein